MMFELRLTEECHEQAFGIHLEVDTVTTVLVEPLHRIGEEIDVRLQARAVIIRIALRRHLQQESRERQ